RGVGGSRRWAERVPRAGRRRGERCGCCLGAGGRRRAVRGSGMGAHGDGSVANDQGRVLAGAVRRPSERPVRSCGWVAPTAVARACAVSSAGGEGGGSGTVPAGAALLMTRLLAGMENRAVVLHGAGRHTVEMAGALAGSRARIVAVTDDDPALWGTTLLGWPV